MGEAILELGKIDLGVTAFCTSDTSRPMLQNILVRQNKSKQIEMIATDGYMLVRHTLQDIVEGEFKPFLIPASVLKAVDKLTWKGNKKRLAPTIEVYADRIEIVEINAVLDYAPEGNSEVEKYPDVDPLITNIAQDDHKEVTLNPEYVVKAMRFLRRTDDGWSVRFRLNAKLAPTEFIGIRSTVFVMPQKS